MKPGWYHTSNSEYHSSEGVSKSQLHKILRSPAHMKAPTEETPAMVIGSAFHTLTLERDKFNDEYAIKPQGMKFSTNDGKAWKAKAEATGKQIISYEDYVNINGMSYAVWNHHPKAAELLSDGEAELSGYWYDPIHSDILCKIRPDWINKRQRVIVDLKSTVDAREHAFTNQAYKLGWTLQSAWYTYGATQITGIEHTEFYFIAVEKEEPYGVQVYKASESLIQHGMIECQKALSIFKECKDVDEWPCYPNEEILLGLPRWATSQGHDAFYD